MQSLSLHRSIDIMVNDHGSIVLLTPASPSGDAWIANNLQVEPWQRAGSSVAVEARMVDDIAAAMVAAGLVVTL